MLRHAVLVGAAAMLLVSACGPLPEPPVAIYSHRTPSVSASPSLSSTPSPSTPTPTVGTPSEEPPVISPSATGGSPPASGSADGLPPVVDHIVTRDRVVFVTIDDGYSKDPAVLRLLTTRQVPVTPFLAVDALTRDHEYFSSVQTVTGQSVQDHTLTHPHLSTLAEPAQEAEICGAATTLGGWYGARPWLFRPPYGDWDQDTRRAARACGMTTLVLWDVSLPHSVLRFASGSRFRRGDILLIHWRPGLARDLAMALDTIAADGLKVGALQDYLPAPA